jgi:hypothetical protein
VTALSGLDVALRMRETHPIRGRSGR